MCSLILQDENGDQILQDENGDQSIQMCLS